MTLEPWIEHDRRRETYVVRWRDASGKKHRDEYSFRDLASAKERKRLLWDRLEKALLGKADDTRGIQECWEAFVKEHGAEVCEARVEKVYKFAFAKFLSLGGMSTMRDVTHQKLLDFKASMLNENLSDATLVGYINVMRVWLRWSLNRKWIGTNPCTNPENNEQIEVKKPKQIDRFFIDEEIEKLEENITDNVFRCIFRLGYMAGLRSPHEILQIHSSHRIYNADKSIWLLRLPPDETKTNSGRIVVLDQKIIDVWPEKQGMIFDDWNARRIHRHFMRAKYRGCIQDKVLKTGRRVIKTIYWTRHTFARQFLERGGNMRALTVLMGHSSYKVTADTYGHLEQNFILEHAKSLPRKRMGTTFRGAMAGQMAEILDTNGQIGQPTETLKTIGLEVISVDKSVS